MAHTLIFGADEKFAEWAASKIPWMTPSPAMKTVAVTDGTDATSKVLAVAVYHSYLPPKKIGGETWYNTVEMSFAAASPRFATRRTIINLLSIPFNQYKVEHVLVVIPSINEHAIAFVKGIGFTPRGTVSRFFSTSVHACVFGLHRNTFKSRDFLRRKKLPSTHSRPQPRGQEHTISAASA